MKVKTESVTSGKAISGSQENRAVSCPVCSNDMVYLQACHLRCNNCGAELSCEDKGWFWG